MTYDIPALRFMLRQWKTGNLDEFVDPGCPQVGMLGVVTTSRGMSGQNLVQRFTSDEISAALKTLYKINAQQATAIVFVDAYDYQIDSLAWILGTSYRRALGFLEGARELMVDILFVQEAARKKDLNPRSGG